MKKIFSAAILALSAVLICGCAKKTEKADGGDSPAVTQAQTTMTTVVTTAPAATGTTVKKTPASTINSPYIKDNARILTDEDVRICEQVITELSSSRMMNAAVVTADDLGGTEAYNYAAKSYNEIFGADKSSGILFLINNDTNEDILYKSGIMTIDPDAEKDALFQATKEIVSGNHGAAAERMLRLGETCPSHTFDRAGFFTPQQISDIEKAAAAYGTEISVCTVGSLATAEQNLAENLGKKRYPDNSGVILLIDGSGKISTYSGTAVPADLKNAAPSSPISNTDDLYNFLIDLLTEKRN